MGIPSILTNLEELELAYYRVKLDHPKRHFVDHPFLFQWIDYNTEEWLVEIKTELENGYSPRTCQICWTPKAGSLLRPGAVLKIKDEVVFNLLVDRFLASIYSEIQSFQGDPDIAYQLNKTPDLKNWIISGFPIWQQWRDRSAKKNNRQC